jgi:hypothetical protein
MTGRDVNTQHYQRPSSAYVTRHTTQLKYFDDINHASCTLHCRTHTIYYMPLVCVLADNDKMVFTSQNTSPGSNKEDSSWLCVYETHNTPQDHFIYTCQKTHHVKVIITHQRVQLAYFRSFPSNTARKFELGFSSDKI